MIHEYFPEEWIALNRELVHHPLLQERLATYDVSKDQDLMFAEIAAYVGVILDGVYLPSETTKIAGHLATQLSLHRPKSKDVEIILPFSETQKH